MTVKVKGNKVLYDNIYIQIDMRDETINIAATSDINLSDVDKFIYAVKLAAKIASNEIEIVVGG